MEARIGTGIVGMSIKVYGREIDEYPHKGETFVWARHGTQYQICVWNFTMERVEIVITVDGLSVMTGQEGSYADRGYCIPSSAHRFSIPGFRLNDSQVAQFVFNSAQASYASQIGKPRNIGVIGAAFFTEKIRPVTMIGGAVRDEINLRGYLHQDMGDMKSVTRGGSGQHSRFFMGDVLSAPSVGPSAGTEFGRPVEHYVSRTEFEREHELTPATVLALRYETRERLLELGVDMDRRPAPAVISPNPFPRQPVGTGCPPPPHWRHRR